LVVLTIVDNHRRRIAYQAASLVHSDLLATSFLREKHSRPSSFQRPLLGLEASCADSADLQLSEFGHEQVTGTADFLRRHELDLCVGQWILHDLAPVERDWRFAAVDKG
jgi:hypothetical protein